MEKNAEIWKADIEKLGFSNLLELSNDMTFNYSAERLKGEVFRMFMAYIQSLETELSQEQKDCVFHFDRLYSFYERLELKIIEIKSAETTKGKKSKL
jgi:hypothetical protein